MPEAPNIKLREPLPPPVETALAPLAYAELDVTSNFSFLRGASHPDELVFRAAVLGYRAIAIADRNSLAGVVRAHDAVKQIKEQGGIAPRLVIGARLVLADGPELLVYPMDREGYGQLCRLLTLGKRRAEKGECLLYLRDFLENCGGMMGVIGESERERRSDEATERRRGEEESISHDSPPSSLRRSVASSLSSPPLRLAPASRFESSLSLLRDALGERLSLAASALYAGDDQTHLAHLAGISKTFDIPLLATNHVHYHDPNRRALQDVLTCIRHHCTIDQAGYRLFANDQRYLKSPAQMHRLFADYPKAIWRAVEVAERCAFSLDELRYEYPSELVPAGERPIDYVRRLAYAGARQRYGVGLASASGMSGEEAVIETKEETLATETVGDFENDPHLDPLPEYRERGQTLAEASPILIPQKICKLLEHELALIEKLKIEAYFLTVHDLVCFARSRGILCQGRGSAANSAVCYCLGVTSVDPNQIDLLFERFVSAARDEPPDIDVDFEHERREEVIQYIYEKYGRERSGMTAVVITYRGRSAVRDVGKTLGLSLDLVDQMAKKLDWWHRGTITAEMLGQLGLDAGDRTIREVIDLTSQLLGFPRHLSQHVGGMVMTRGPLCELIPIENASMPDRTVIEWDKDDIDTLGILKVDALALGMLTCISKALRFINGECSTTENTEDTEGERARMEDGEWRMEQNCISSSSPSSSVLSVFSVVNSLPKLELHTIPPEDPAVYAMISDADTIGVFQIESRAQMTMLPRLKPANFYDLVIEVAIVRPGPIQGNMVHPYLRRRNNEEKVTYPSEALREVLSKTLGVPLFQEQAMKVAMVGAGFSAGEADQLRRAMAAWRKSGAIERFYPKIINGMLANGYTREFAEQCFNQIKGFGEYGFPESHAASFALLVYVSAWIKRYHPAAFCAALLNSLPMGFYAPAQIVRDAREHGVTVRAADVNHSDWDCTLEDSSKDFTTENTENTEKKTWGIGGPAVRLGFRLIKGFRKDFAERVVRSRGARFMSVSQFHRATALPVHAVRRLAEADAFASLGLTRRQAVWETLELKDEDAPLFDQQTEINPLGNALFRNTGILPVRVDRNEKDFASTKSMLIEHGQDARVMNGPISSETQTAFLPPMPLGQEVMTDYATTTLSLKQHPLALLREHLNSLRIMPAAGLADALAGKWVKVAGLVLIRQRPGTASGIVFETIEDETGVANLIIRPDIFDRYRPAARHAGLLQADGYVERQGQVVHVMVKRLFDLSHLLAGYQLTSRDFH